MPGSRPVRWGAPRRRGDDEIAALRSGAKTWLGSDDEHHETAGTSQLGRRDATSRAPTFIAGTTAGSSVNDDATVSDGNGGTRTQGTATVAGALADNAAAAVRTLWFRAAINGGDRTGTVLHAGQRLT